MVKTLCVNDYVNKYIEICKSNSGKCGSILREAHYMLGKYLGEYIADDLKLEKNKVAIVVMMRAGLLFSLGIADSLEEKNEVKIIFSYEEDCNFNSYDKVIICDAVINSGKTIFDYIKSNNLNKFIIATNVISQKNLSLFDNYKLYSTRVSLNSYKGTIEKKIIDGKGPDTGDRLFNSLFYGKEG